MKYALLGSVVLAAFFGNPFGGGNPRNTPTLPIGVAATNIQIYGNQSTLGDSFGLRVGPMALKQSEDTLDGGIYNSANGSWLIRGTDGDNRIILGDPGADCPIYIHKPGSGAPATPGSVSAWMPVNVNGTNFFYPLYK